MNNKKYSRVYVEITNICNRSCSFCPGTKREKGRMTYEEFIFASYRILFANKLTVMSRTPAAIYNRFTHRSDFTQDVLYKSAYVNLFADKMIYGTNFKPDDSVNRAYLATLLARVYDKLN